MRGVVDRVIVQVGRNCGLNSIPDAYADGELTNAVVILRDQETGEKNGGDTEQELYHGSSSSQSWTQPNAFS
jgi:hypothetical protein